MKSLWLHLLLCVDIFALSAGLLAPLPVVALPVAQSAPPALELGDPRELEAFVDGVINPQMADLHIAGAVVVIVKDGKVLLNKGYGYADVEKQISVDPETTIFRPGSVNKLITWTAVMQLKEDANGQVRYMTVDNVPYWGYVKQPWHGRQDLYFGILVFSLLFFLTTVIVAIARWIIARIKHSPARPSPWQAKVARGMGLVLSLTFIAFAVSFFMHPFDPGHNSNRIMAWLVAVLSLCVVVLAFAAWRLGWWKLASRMHYTLIALAGLSFIWFMAYWNLLMLP